MMTVCEFRKTMAETKYIPANSELHKAFHAFSQQALKLTAELNGRYHEPAEVRRHDSEAGQDMRQGLAGRTSYHLPRCDHWRGSHSWCRLGCDEGRPAAHCRCGGSGKGNQDYLKGSYGPTAERQLHRLDLTHRRPNRLRRSPWRLGGAGAPERPPPQAAGEGVE